MIKINNFLLEKLCQKILGKMEMNSLYVKPGYRICAESFQFSWCKPFCPTILVQKLTNERTNDRIGDKTFEEIDLFLN